MNRTISIAALLIAAAHAASIAHAGGCSYSLGSYLNGFMPDFDQKRQPGPLFFDGMQFIPIPDGLPGNGFNYCSPTAHTNTMAYLANHGFPALMPGGVAQAWGSQTNYERVTDALQEMGVRMQTDPDDGTLCCGQSGLIEYLDVHAPGKFTVSGKSASELYAPSLGDLAFCAIAGGFVHIMVGWYENTGINEWDKAGGHVTTMVALEGWCGGDRKIGIRDPGNGDSNLMAQAFFASNYYTLTPMNAFFASGEDNGGIEVHYQRTHERMQGYNTSDGRIGLINGYRVVLPKFGVTLTPPPTQQLQLLNPIRPTHHPIPPIQPLPVAGLASITDCEIDSDGFSVLCLGRDASGVPDPSVYRVNRGTGDVLPVYTGDEPREVATTRHRFFAIVDRTDLVIVDGDQVRSAPFSMFALPNTPIEFDDRTDRLIALNPVARQFVIFNPKELTIDQSVPWPSAVATNGECYFALSPLDGSIWLRSQNSPNIYKIRFDRVLGAVIEETANIPSSVGDIGIDIHVEQTREHILLARQTGVVVDFVKNTAGQWAAATGSDFAGLPAFGGIKLSRSRTNDTAAITVGPQHIEELPGTTSPPTWDCAGDADQDGEVDFADITLVLTMWGSTAQHPADTDSNGSVGFSDVTRVLSSWGPCE